MDLTLIAAVPMRTIAVGAVRFGVAVEDYRTRLGGPQRSLPDSLSADVLERQRWCLAPDGRYDP
ncbi:MAG: hypothetical protein ACJAZO_001894 [Myxococcota bacterium]